MEKILKQFKEVKDKIPFERMGKQHVSDGQYLFGDVIDWCRDYFNEPKNEILTYMLLGYYFSNKEMKNEIRY